MSAETEAIKMAVQVSAKCLRLAANDLGQAIRVLSIANLHMMRGDNEAAFEKLESVSGFLQEAYNYAVKADEAAEELVRIGNEG